MAKWSLAFGAFLILGFFASCSGKSILSAGCHSCVEETQSWNEVSWKDLADHWKGNVETTRNEKVKIKREKSEQPAEFHVVSLDEFYKGYGLTSCEGVSSNAVALNGQLWSSEVNSQKKEFEAFVPAEDDQIAYGRLAVENQSCHFQRLGRVMNKNRLG